MALPLGPERHLTLAALSEASAAPVTLSEASAAPVTLSEASAALVTLSEASAASGVEGRTGLRQRFDRG